MDGQQTNMQKNLKRWLHKRTALLVLIMNRRIPMPQQIGVDLLLR